VGSFASVSIVALFCYTFLSLTLLAAEKSRIINAYLLILGSMVLWTGGSLLMRLQFFPSVTFWYHSSILGLLMFVFGYFVFAQEFIESKRRGALLFWGVLIGALWLVNVKSGFFLAPPTLVTGAGGAVSFVYEFSWTAGLLFLVLLGTVLHMSLLLRQYIGKSATLFRKFFPVALGLGFMILGHLMIFLPIFQGIPTDIISGVLNAACMFYGLYRRRLFRLTLLVSRGSCYVLSGALSIAFFAQLIEPIRQFMEEKLTLSIEYQLLIISLLFTIATVCCYRALKFILDHVFIREEIAQAEQLKEFSLAISRSLNMKEILECIVEIVQKLILPQKIYIFIEDSTSKRFHLAGNSNPLDSKSLVLDRDHPMIEWFRSHNDCLLMTEFRRTVQYKAIWQKEKRLLDTMGIECLAPLKDNENLVGIIMLSKKQGNKNYSYNDLSLLDSINSISFIAVTNSRLYSRAFIEARTDELTGLYNRKYFYELLDEEFGKLHGQALALCMLSIDDLKLYNQLYGYKEGDQAIAKIAAILSGCVGENGYVARYSGKVFAILLPKYDLRAAKGLADNIRIQVSNMHHADKDYAIRALTLSGGVAAIPYSASSPRDLLEHADLALFHVKRSGKNAVLAYTNGDYTLEKTRQNLEQPKSAYSEYENTVYALMAAIDAKDHYTFNHSMNAVYYATKLAEALQMNGDYIEIIREAALLHDIGKIGIPEHILNKPGKLTAEEFEVMRGHVEQSIAMIKFLPSLDYVIPSVIGHHERFDGLGYPRGLAGEDIPMGARILCIADSFDAMTSARSYKQAYPLEYALAIMEEQAGHQFDPHMAAIFVSLVRSGKVTVKSQSTSESELVSV